MNNKKVIGITAVTILALAALGGGIALAQSTQPGRGMGGYGPGYGGMMGGYGNSGSFGPGGMTLAPHGFGGVGGAGGNGMMGAVGGAGDAAWMQNMHEWAWTEGGMHTLVWNGLADALNLTPDELNAELASGKTLTEIADAQGVTREQLAAALETSVKAGLDKAVADGTLTQAQADQMLSHTPALASGASVGRNFEWMIDHMGSGFGGCHGNFAPQTA